MPLRLSFSGYGFIHLLRLPSHFFFSPCFWIYHYIYARAHYRLSIAISCQRSRPRAHAVIPLYSSAFNKASPQAIRFLTLSSRNIIGSEWIPIECLSMILRRYIYFELFCYWLADSRLLWSFSTSIFSCYFSRFEIVSVSILGIATFMPWFLHAPLLTHARHALITFTYAARFSLLIRITWWRAASASSSPIFARLARRCYSLMKAWLRLFMRESECHKVRRFHAMRSNYFSFSLIIFPLMARTSVSSLIRFPSRLPPRRHFKHFDLSDWLSGERQATRRSTSIHSKRLAK